ncbi:threonylcarbamoyl-AMP synthase [Candidatus Bathyarchaeota archaeon]|nr:threonylcarbamoyl-AMP synthase [Candidatus Bathyarchaeota archaeon]
MTEICEVEPQNPSIEIIRRAARIIRMGGLVAFPTETVYGLGADAMNATAVRKIFAVKERPPDNPLIVHVADEDSIKKLAAHIPDEAKILIERFFPGPLTIVLEKKPVVPDVTTANLPTVALRMPNNKVALSLIEESGTPIAAPSANKAGRPSPTKAQHVLEDLKGEVDLILDGGPTTFGLESTVVDLTVNPPQLLRPGAVTIEMLNDAIGQVQVHPSVKLRISSEEFEAKSPGMKYRHYAPRAELIVVTGRDEDVAKKIGEMINMFRSKGLRVGVASTTGMEYSADYVEKLGRSKLEIASRLYDGLRRFDEAEVDIIIAEGVDECGLGLAIMNRLRKASDYRVVRA